VSADATFFCEALACDGTRIAVCVARQVICDVDSEYSNRRRGISPEFPRCRSEVCPQGRLLRALFGEDDAKAIRYGRRRGVRDALPFDEPVPTLDHPAWGRDDGG
jgi:hypothetical protein